MTSGSFSLSAESTIATICVSVAQPSGNSGRSGRSVSREVRISRLRRAPLALEKSAGNFSGGIGVFAVIHRERKKIFFGRLVVHAGRGQHHRVAVSRHDGAMRLTGHLAGFKASACVRLVPNSLVQTSLHILLPRFTGNGYQIRENTLGKCLRRREAHKGAAEG